MQASSLTIRLRRGMVVRDWAWWELPPLLRGYVAMPFVLALAVVGVTAAYTDWRLLDLGKFLILAACGVISVASTPRIAYTYPGLTRDFTTVWALPTAILLPPVYAALVPIPFIFTMQMFVHRGVLYRRVFTGASISLCCVAISFAFRLFPPSFAGGNIGHGVHAFTWAIAVAACEFLGNRAQHFMIVGAIKISDPKVRVLDMEWDRDALQGLFVEIDLAVLITLAVAVSPALVVIALPTVLLVRRFLVHPILVAQSRVDSKTGLLNVSTWEAEAENEISRSVRTRNPVALALVDIDHFKRVNDTHGHLVGDKVLKAVAKALSGDLRTYDRAGRFGGEEFVILLAQTSEDDAKGIAERLRAGVAELAVPVSDRPDATVVRVTISIGVAAMERGETRELNDLLAAADSALYHAKKSGRNLVAVAADEPNMLEAELNGHRVAVVQVDPRGASLGPATSL
jgi:diguanylate cyclase (GGDEF)-like protein